MSKKFSFKRIFAMVMTVAMLASMLCVGFTANAAEGVNPALIDFGRTGSLTIYKYEMNDVTEAGPQGIGEASDFDNVPDSATPLEGVEFTIYKVAGLTEYFGKDAKDIPTPSAAADLITDSTPSFVQTTDENGYCKFSDLPLGIYLVTETDCPAQVTKKTPSFVLALPMTNSALTGWNYDLVCYPKNETAYSDITVKKIDSDSGKELPGAQFTLYHSYDGTNYSSIKTGITTGADGTATITHLPAQVYYRFVETKTSDLSYILDSTVSYDFYIDMAGNIREDATPEAAVNEDKVITVGNDKPYIHKYILDGKKGTKGIDNTADYEKFGDTVYWEITTTVPREAAKMYTYTIKDTMDTGLSYKAAEICVDNKKRLTEGTDYTVTKSGQEVTFTIKPASIANYKEVEVYYDTVLTDSAPLGTDIKNASSLTYTNNIGTDSTYTIDSEQRTVHTGGFSFKKVSNKDGKGLEGAEFRLYRTEADAKAGTNVVDTQTSDKDGLVQFKGLKYGGFSADEDSKNINGAANGSTDYWIVETKAPSGYVLFKEPVKITVNAQSHLTGSNDTFKNTPLVKTPQTGGTASVVPMVGGILLIAGTALILAVKRRKRDN